MSNNEAACESMWQSYFKGALCSFQENILIIDWFFNFFFFCQNKLNIKLAVLMTE